MRLSSRTCRHPQCPRPSIPPAWAPVGRLRPDRRHVPPRGRRRAGRGTVRIAFDRPEVRNAFRPHTVDELYRVLDHARMTPDVGCVLLTGNGPSAKDGGRAFCSGGDQRIRGRSGYQYADRRDRRHRGRGAGQGRRRPAAHPRGAAADPHDAEGRRRGGQRLGRGRRALAARRLRPHHRRAASTRASSRPTPTSGRFDGGYGSAYLAKHGRPEERPRDLLPRPHVRRRRDAADGCGQHRGRPRRPGARRRSRWPPRSTARARRRSGC